MRRFFTDRLLELTGVALLALSLFVTVAFTTYHAEDPSWNLANTSEDIQNMAGSAGAFFAVPLLELFGWGVSLIALIPLLWGIQFIRREYRPHLWLRSLAWCALMVCASTSISFLDPFAALPEQWPSVSLGGYVGASTSEWLAALLPEHARIAATLTITLALSYFVFGISKEEWMRIGYAIAAALRWTLHLAYGIARALLRAVGIAIQKLLALRGIKVEIASPAPAEAKEKKQKRSPAERRVVSLTAKKKTEAQQQSSFDLPMEGDYQLPSMELLTEAPVRKNVRSESALSQNAELLERVLDDFGINGEIVEVQTGPVVTLYVLEPSPGTKSSRVIGLADDIARSMSAVSARIAVIPGRNAIGIELPNVNRETVFLRELLEDPSFTDPKLQLTLALGKDIGGTTIQVDLAKMPHVLVAGTTGSGKSVGINAMILSLLYKFRPSECKFIMIDPKMLELSVYDGIPHLLCPVVTEPGKAVVALKWAVKEMEQRYRLMSQLNVRNIANYNQKIGEAKAKGKPLVHTVQTGYNPETGEPIMESLPLSMEPLPFIVVIVDEMADLMLVAGKDVEGSIQRLAQMARAAGIHLIMATQRPSVDVITGVIKANFPTRISFQVTSKIDSRTILGEQGAEQLLGMGDMLYMSGGGRIIRVHGAFVGDDEVQTIAAHWRNQGSPTYIEDVTKADEEDGFEAMGGGEEADPLYDQAVSIVIRDGKASTSYIQRCLKIGYNRAATLIEQMERAGVVGPANHVGKREILVREHA